MANKQSLNVLKRRSEFNNLKNRGRRILPTPWLLVNYSLNQKGHLRCGWTVPRYVGNAVLRNRMKRLCREYFRKQNQLAYNFNVDINVVFRKANKEIFKKLQYSEFCQIMDRAWEKIPKKKEGPT